ncbi:MAG: ribonuclease T [Rhizobiales bacterium 65-9]|nr:ribonuclease T2 [Hyphomicrobiales bacterium]OJY32881.1 MAG: ribonuclease T [Rhizobiales bacterium 65-9]
MRITASVARIVAALMLLCAPALAQRRGSPGDFDFYVLALSWSPGFCDLEGDRKGRGQCDSGSGAGFVLHGLWPQYERGYPSDCGFGQQPSRIAMEAARGVYPDLGLARYEWRKHGTCSGLSPQGYFNAARDALRQVQIPSGFSRLRGEQRMTPMAIERAFVAANPGLRADMIGVSCQRGVLQEVRICLDRNLKGFRMCPEVGRRDCRAPEISVPAPR